MKSRKEPWKRKETSPKPDGFNTNTERTNVILTNILMRCYAKNIYVLHSDTQDDLKYRCLATGNVSPVAETSVLELIQPRPKYVIYLDEEPVSEIQHVVIVPDEHATQSIKKLGLGHTMAVSMPIIFEGIGEHIACYFIAAWNGKLYDLNVEKFKRTLQDVDESVNVDYCSGKITVQTNQRIEEGIINDMKTLVKHITKALLSERLEIPYPNPCSPFRVVLGSGGEIRMCLRPEQYRMVTINETCFGELTYASVYREMIRYGHVEKVTLATAYERQPRTPADAFLEESQRAGINLEAFIIHALLQNPTVSIFQERNKGMLVDRKLDLAKLLLLDPSGNIIYNKLIHYNVLPN